MTARLLVTLMMLCSMPCSSSAQSEKIKDYTVKITYWKIGGGGGNGTALNKVVKLRIGDRVITQDCGTFQGEWYRLVITTDGPNYMSVKILREKAASAFADGNGRIAEVNGLRSMGGSFTYNESRDLNTLKYTFDIREHK